MKFPKYRSHPILEKKKEQKTFEWRKEILDSVIQLVICRKKPVWIVPDYKGTYVPEAAARQPREEIVRNIQSRFAPK